MKEVRVFVVDDHPIVNRGLVSLQDTESNRITVVGQAFSGFEAVQKLQETETDVVLMDIRLPDIDGIEAGRRIKKHRPETKIIVLTTFNDREYVTEAMNAGVEGFLLKEASEEVIVRTIRSVCEGKIFISTETAVGPSQATATLVTSGDDASTIGKINQLSQREQEVFMLLVHGKDNAEIASELYLSEHTVRNYVSKIYSIIDVKNRSSAIVWAQENGIV